MVVRILTALFAVFIPTSAVFAQCRECMPATIFSWDRQAPSALGELPEIVTDRPDFTEASSTVGYGVVQLEMGYTFTKSTGTESHSWGEPLLRVGALANWLELRMAVFPVTEISTVTDSGAENLYLGAKLWLAQQDGWLPELAIMPQMTVPVGSSAFSADRVLPGGNLLYSWDVGDNLSIAGSTQFNRAVGDPLSPYDEWAQSIAIGRSFTEQLGGYFEWFALIPHDTSFASTEHYINGGFTWLWTDDAQFDVRIGKGLSEASDDYLAGVGLSLRFR